MKRLFLILLLIPFVANAEMRDFELQLPGSYYIPEATLHGECSVNGQSFSDVGSASAATPVIPYSIDLVPGDIMDCQLWTTYGDKTSVRSGVSTYTVPFPDLTSPSAPVITFIGLTIAP